MQKQYNETHLNICRTKRYLSRLFASLHEGALAIRSVRLYLKRARLTRLNGSEALNVCSWVQGCTPESHRGTPNAAGSRPGVRTGADPGRPGASPNETRSHPAVLVPSLCGQEEPHVSTYRPVHCWCEVFNRIKSSWLCGPQSQHSQSHNAPASVRRGACGHYDTFHPGGGSLV